MLRLFLVLLLCRPICKTVVATSVRFMEENMQHFEGDIMVMSPPQDMRKWIDGVVPFKFAKSYPNMARKRVRRAMSEFAKYTCIKFRDATDADRDYIYIENRPECASFVGRIGGRQSVRLSAVDCTARFGTILHELMHAIGIYHEQSRKDRDSFVRIVWENLIDDERIVEDFRKTDDANVHDYGLPYDPRSLMHYRLNAFAKSAQLKTIELTGAPIDANEVGQRINFSKLDLIKINRLYGCVLMNKNLDLVNFNSEQ